MSPTTSIKDHPLYIDASMIKCFSACPEQFRELYVENIVPIEPNIYLSFGTGLHLSHEAFWKGEDLRSALNIGLNYLEGIDQELITRVDKRKKFNSLIDMLPDMMACYYKEVEQDLDKVLYIEHEWSIPYDPIPGVNLCGKIDRFTTEYELRDLKGMSEVGISKQQMLRNFGMALYDWYLCQIGKTPKSIGMDILTKPYRCKKHKLLEEVPDNCKSQYRCKPCKLIYLPLDEMIAHRKEFEKQIKSYVTQIKFYLDHNTKIERWEMATGIPCQLSFGYMTFDCDYLQKCNYGNSQKLVKYKPREEHLEIRKSKTLAT